MVQPGGVLTRVRHLLIGMAIALLGGVASATTESPGSLNDAAEEGRVAIESVTGTGGSSGPALNAVLVNAAPSAQRIVVHLEGPVFEGLRWS